MGDRRPLSPGFRGACRTTRAGSGLPEGEHEGGFPSGITHDLVLLFDLPARRMEREERLLAFHGGNLNATLWDVCNEGGGRDARFLLSRGAGAGSASDGWPFLQRAANNGHLAVVEALLDVQKIAAGAEELGGALGSAAFGGCTAVAALLLDRGADIDFQNHYALLVAIANGRLETARLLLDRGADPNARSSWSGTALKVARDRSHHEVVALLLARGAVDDTV